MIITTLYDSTTAWQAAKVVPAKPKATRMSPEEAAASMHKLHVHILSLPEIERPSRKTWPCRS